MFITKRTYQEMQGLIDTSRKSLADAEDRISQRNKLLESLHNENKELKARIVDLENNIEFLYNNLSAQKKKLVRPDKQN